jgi:hypothetical protein
MDVKEKEIADAVLSEYPFVFRNDNGRAVVGGEQFIAKVDGRIHIRKGQRVVLGGVPIKYGLFPGSGDMVGWSTVEVTPDMVGKRLAVFTSIEIKTENDRLSEKQKKWRDNVRAAGGIAEVWQERNGEIVKG